MKIVILDGYTSNPGDLSWDEFEKLGNLTVHERTPYDKIVERIGDAEAVITNKTPITKETIDACPNIKYIGVLATGFNVVDIDAAKAKGIPVANVPAYSTLAVAQLVMAFLLEICHNVGAHSKAVFEGRWTNSKDFCFWDYPLMELSGKTIGIIGFGRIGQAVGKVAAALGMNVIAHNRSQSEEGRKIGQYVTMDELLAKADVISIHAPLSPSTQDLINKDAIAKMKDGAILINTARGLIVNEQDVADALNSGKLYAAGLDVVSVEPIKADNPLLKAKNCFITPHIAWAPTEARTRLIEIASSNLKAFMDGEATNIVNK